MDKALNIIKNDPWLEPYADAINGRHQHVVEKEKELVGKKTLSDFATGHMYFGLHRTDKGWTFREWAPNATEIYLVGDFNDWQLGNQSAGKGHEARRLVQAESVLGRWMR